MTLARDSHKKTNITLLTQDERKAYIKKTYERESYFHQLFHADFLEQNCLTFAQQFRQDITEVLLANKIINEPVALESLHQFLPDEIKAYNYEDGKNKISHYFSTMTPSFEKTYHAFIRYLRTAFIQEPFWFQATPILRFHCPEAINNHHFPRYHTDICYGHPPEEINIWLPLTEILAGHSFYLLNVKNSNKMVEKFSYDLTAFIQSSIHDEAFTAACETHAINIETPLGHLLAFDARCLHTGGIMRNHTRVSMDVRLLPVSQAEQMTLEHQTTGKENVLFTPGFFYHALNSDQLAQPNHDTLS